MKDLSIKDKSFLIGLVVEDIERLAVIIDGLDLSDDLDLRAFYHHKQNALDSVMLLNRMYEGEISALYNLRVITIDTAQIVERFIKQYTRELAE